MSPEGKGAQRGVEDVGHITMPPCDVMWVTFDLRDATCDPLIPVTSLKPGYLTCPAHSDVTRPHPSCHVPNALFT